MGALLVGPAAGGTARDLGAGGQIVFQPARIAAVLRDKLLKGIGILPELQDPMLHTGKVEVSIDFLEPGQFVPPQ